MASQTPRESRPDPYELERLADELAAREVSSASLGQPYDPLPARPDLPIYVPLSHDDKFLTAETFDVESFLLSRSHTSLPELRTELREYLSSLKEELVLLINNDYEDFISLSTDLRGEGDRLSKLKAPLNTLREQIQASRQSLLNIQDAIQAKLDARTKLRDQKALLHLLLKISESITRLESLLLISQSNDWHHTDIPHMSGIAGHSPGLKTQGSRVKHLSRVSTEYTQLLYHISKARAENCAYVNEIQWSVDRIRDTLTSDLDHLFSTTLLYLTATGDARASDVERPKAVADITECLRIYDSLGLWRAAEDLIRKNVVRPFIKKSIYPDALAASHSPIIPHTPLPPLPSSRLLSNSWPPRTPYTPHTPYTAFSSKQHAFETPSVPFFDGSGDSLANLYNQILRFVERDLGRLMELAERVSLKASPRQVDSASLATLPRDLDASVQKRDGFDIMANIVWPEIGQALMDELGTVVFAAGKPDEFLKRYTTTQVFIRALEFIAPSTQSVQSTRSHPVFISFQRRWQLPVYFQLRWKDIVSKLEDALSVTTINPDAVQLEPGRSPFLTLQAEHVWASIASCWSAEVFIPDLAHRFWKVTLQLLSRYKTWLDTSLPRPELARVVPSDKGSATSAQSRSSTPQAVSETTSAENNAADDLLLKQYGIALIDIKAMVSQVSALWREEISVVLPEVSVKDEVYTDAQAVLRDQLNSIESLTGPLSKQVVAILIRRACDALLPVRSIPSQFRAMSSKRMPTEPSYFVPLILRPLKAFFGIGGPSGVGDRLRDALLKESAVEVFDSVCQRYIQYLTAMKKTEESLRRLKKGKKSTLTIFSSGNTSKDDDRDEERIRTQMVLDVEAIGQEGKSLSVDISSLESYAQLVQMVQNEFADGEQ
ncbi:oligomeric golgi complex component, COG2-domain-containing protein [Phlebopus sp. FC_14]|nr:oligomeric golgi complex component, COG2-domain-containing protein [Phlebopus sp. FC_14]